jgi:glycosyltransferase involved in cell wall biosynthesis
VDTIATEGADATVRGPGARSRIQVTHVIHSLGPGGAESVLVDLADAAPTAGIDLAVIALSPAPPPVHAQALRARGIRVVELDLPRWDPRGLLGTIAALRADRPHVVHTHLKHADIIGAIAGAALRLPVVSTLHLIEDAPVGAMARYKRTAGLAIRRRSAARTIAVSSFQRDWYRELSGSEKGLVVLPNGVADPGEVEPAQRLRLRRQLGVGDGQPLIVSAALMRPEKGHALLLDAVSLLPDEPRPFVALAGAGELRSQLEARVAGDPVLRDRVHFLGYRDDVPALLGAADLVLHTSLADALPTTVMQALAVGVPVVATHVGGIPDIVGPDAGLLVPPEPQAVARATTRLLGNPQLRARMGEAGRSSFLEQFEATGWAGRLRALYDSVLEVPADGRTAWSAPPPTRRTRGRSHRTTDRRGAGRRQDGAGPD